GNIEFETLCIKRGGKMRLQALGQPRTVGDNWISKGTLKARTNPVEPTLSCFPGRADHHDAGCIGKPADHGRHKLSIFRLIFVTMERSPERLFRAWPAPFRKGPEGIGRLRKPFRLSEISVE